jgi:hypothetical protein
MRQNLRLARCDDRNTIAHDHPDINGPREWTNLGQKLDNGLVFLGFDFFVNWSRENYPTEDDIWLKVPVSSNFFIDHKGHEASNIREMLVHEKDFVELVRFGKSHGLNVSAIVFNDFADFCDKMDIWRFTVYHNQSSFSCQRENLDSLCGMIRMHSGGPVRVGAKGLMYGTTRLECMLSKTDSAWPGDVDAVIVDTKNNYCVHSIIEFKKCTSRARFRFEDEKFSNYYPYPDRRKYDRLISLSRRLSSESIIPIYIVYYSNVKNEKRIIIEEINASDQPHTVKRSIFNENINSANDVRDLILSHTNSSI